MAQTVAEQNVIALTPRRKKSPFIKHLPLYIMMVPSLIYLIIDKYMPMAGLVFAFKKIDFTKGLFRSDWYGFKNFEYLFKTSDAWIITRNTILYNVSFIIINTILSIIVALLLNEITKKSMVKLYQTIVLLPYLISMVIVSYLVYAFLSVDAGFLNKTILPMFGITEPVGWYFESKYWPFILPLVSAWKGIGFTCVVYLASIIGIDKQYYEAAMLDGASKWKQIRTITLPLIQPTIIMMILFAIGRIFYSDFGLFYQVPMDSGAIYSTTNVIDTYVYRALMRLGDIGMAAAAGLYQSVVGFVLVMVSNLVVRKINNESALF